MHPRLLILVLLSAALAACGTSRGQREKVWPYPEPPVAPSQPLPQEPVPGMPSPIPPTPPQPLPPGKSLESYPRSAGQVSGAAVLSLLQQAQDARAQGQPQQAVSALERALRIEPRNYFVWSALAQAHLDQGHHDQAESVAQRSNSLARGNLYVELENWRTIHAARVARGDAENALQAQARVADIERILGGGQ